MQANDRGRDTGALRKRDMENNDPGSRREVSELKRQLEQMTLAKDKYRDQVLDLKHEVRDLKDYGGKVVVHDRISNN